ncbi:hypothetical protein [Denitrobaculum tricleocarpae]|uniref:hypothetical protein n=1 Tax=Denitrobaculum tricleocarpae TaxID=2591009 RepID=UPI0015D43A50|nr:hypothetical protein [Denitrobaculum tricleocarpae]
MISAGALNEGFVVAIIIEAKDGKAEAHQQTAHFKAALPDLLALAARRERVPFVPFVPI